MNERTNIEFAQWNKSLVNKTFYFKCPDNDKYFKTVFIKHNPFTNSLQPHLSNATYGEPPDGMEPISPLMLQRLLRVNVNGPFF